MLKQRATHLLKFHNKCVLDRCMKDNYRRKSYLSVARTKLLETRAASLQAFVIGWWNIV